jgi:nicotinamidase-related amidase
MSTSRTNVGRFERGDALLVVDVFNDFVHEDGDRLLASFRERAPNMKRAMTDAREVGVPVVYANDGHARWDGDVRCLVAAALNGRGGELLEPLVPREGESVLLKHRYSAFDHTSLDLLLESLHVARVLLIGAATEACVVQTAIDARELGLKASIIADACARADPELEEIALRYASRVGGIHIV